MFKIIARFILSIIVLAGVFMLVSSIFDEGRSSEYIKIYSDDEDLF